MQTITLDIQSDIVVLDPDNAFGSPAYEGPISDMWRSLEPGEYVGDFVYVTDSGTDFVAAVTVEVANAIRPVVITRVEWMVG